MLVRSSFIPCLAPLLLLVADHSVPISHAQAQQLAVRRSSRDYDESDVRIWPRRGGQEQDTPPVPIAVRKMMDHEDEMFFQDYWQFEHVFEARPPSKIIKAAENTWTNASLFLPFHAPLALHRDPDASPFYPLWARALVPKLHDRAFHCPNGTDACTDINRPNSCCPSGDSCQLVTDSGQGHVACCGSGQTCAGKVQDCAQDYQSCPGAAGGGCCVPGYACVGTVGCKSCPPQHASFRGIVLNPVQ